MEKLKNNHKVLTCILICIFIILILVLIIIKVQAKNNKDVTINKNPIVTMKVKDYGVVKIELYPEVAPNTVNNFISLINEGYYNGLTFHRIVSGFMIQGGNKEETEINKCDFSIEGEFAANGFDNSLKHTTGVISMARADYGSVFKDITTEGYNSANTQFFIMLEEYGELDGYYAAFGKVVEGMEIVNILSELQTNSEDEPLNKPVIEEMIVDTFGVEYEEPQRKEAFDIVAYIQNIVEGNNEENQLNSKEETNNNNINISNNTNNNNINANNNNESSKTINYIRTPIKGCIITYTNSKTGEYSYKGKCETCGNIESTGHTRYTSGGGRSVFNSSYYCPKCKKMQDIQIQLDEEYN